MVAAVVVVIAVVAMAILAATRAPMVAMMVLALVLALALVQTIHYNYSPFDYRRIEMASYKLRTFVVYTYFGMCTNHKPNHLHSFR